MDRRRAGARILVLMKASIILEMEKLNVLESGLGQVCLHLGQALARQSSSALPLGFYLPSGYRRRFGAEWEYLPVRRLHRWTGVPASGCRVWHCLHQDSRYWPCGAEARVVLTIHDLNFLVHSRNPRRLRQRLRQLQERVNRAAALTVISRFTEQVVRAYLRVPDVPFLVIHNGNALDLNTTPQRPSFAPAGAFLLSIAHIHPKKNLGVLLPLLTRRRDLSLVLAGQNDHPCAAHLRREAARLGVAERLIMPGVVDDAAKMWLLQNCLAFVLPSLAEGFGLPVVEAMSLGKPVFLSSEASLPEVGGGDAFYWPDFDPDAMERVLSDGLDAFHADAEWPERMRRRAGMFSWDEAARRYLALYESLLT